MKIDTSHYKVKADQHQLLLYEKGDAPEDSVTEPGEELRGYHCVGHYTTVEGVLNGLRWRLTKQRTKRAQTLLEFVEKSIAALDAQRPVYEAIAKQAAEARRKVTAILHPEEIMQHARDLIDENGKVRKS